MSRLVVISNRVALPNQTQTGGLASAMDAALKELGGLWFGWSGNLASETGAEVHEVTKGRIAYATIDMSKSDYEAYYSGFANRALWPLFHYRGDLVDYQRDHLEGYLRVNRLFAEQVAKLIQKDDIVWVHDYHLIPLAGMLRELGVTNRIGFFLHTPLPAAGLLITLPRHRELFEPLSAYDLVGVHTHRDLRALEDYFLHELGAAMQTGGRIRAASGRVFRAGVFPISIDTDDVIALAEKAQDSGAVGRLKASLDDRQLIIGVDRLDYSKGLPERFDGFARLLRDHKTLRGHVSLLQIAPPSRSDVPEYRLLRRTLERSAGHINGQYAEPDWVPIRYVNKSFAHTVLAGYYRTAKVGLVTPLRDGMNLVAKEYVACQDRDDPGVLVLSRFAGAAQELDAALFVNPADIDEVSGALAQALAMPLKERQRRHRAMMHALEANTITTWRTAFLDALRHKEAMRPVVA
ncbi:alpha,alpha-trehalose-phosphate synthase (UDP-forming) [Luteibacter yeojuensis]|uniref:Trehalose-6-phosphate synthase n=1 Tax=Luteibacter yeojuensis TaxID=345309 RepID=A0A0F3KU27_9GAMM|nr:alpha,alpha-trehalose-phosphate synthase (UDP-forming) [Luteibacter yeojuensis]KJV34770.1 alpha,alpha-trehalose-phosphate synthase [Luteibacter yeojuensis]